MAAMTQGTDDTTRPGADRIIDPALLDVLVCPVTHGPLDYDRVKGELVSRQLGKAFPIRDGMPVMLVDEARDLEDSENETRWHD
jgi:uncharacterized protein YbaR (Trm112 family)